MNVSDDPMDSLDNYQKYLEGLDKEDLVDIFQGMNRDQYPERYDLVMKEMEKRKIITSKEDGDSLLEKVYGEGEKYRTFWPRFWASLIDEIFFVVVLSLVMVALLPGLENVMDIIVPFLFLAYFIVLHGLFGQTLGKFLCKVKVVSVAEKRINFQHAIMRDIVPLILITILFIYYIFVINPALSNVVIPGMSEEEVMVMKAIKMHEFSWFFVVLRLVQLLWLLTEVITMLTNDKRRALHDYIAGTVVVRKEFIET